MMVHYLVITCRVTPLLTLSVSVCPAGVQGAQYRGQGDVCTERDQGVGSSHPTDCYQRDQNITQTFRIETHYSNEGLVSLTFLYCIIMWLGNFNFNF